MDTSQHRLRKPGSGVAKRPKSALSRPKSAVTKSRTPLTRRSEASEHIITRDGALVVIHGLDLGRKYSLMKPEIVAGRSTDADIRLDDELVSRRHVAFRLVNGQVSLKDLTSTNGTYVNDEKTWDRQLRDGDRVTVGRTVFKFLAGGNIETSYHDEVYRRTNVDNLTDVFNRRYFDETLEREASRSRRYERPLSLIMIDVDHFKDINDKNSHLAGDRVLTHIATVLVEGKRREDILSRYGGDEFALLLPESDVNGACTLAENVRALVENTPCEFAGNTINVTISVGVAELALPEAKATHLLLAADKALYRAKTGGRNRVCSIERTPSISDVPLETSRQREYD